MAKTISKFLALLMALFIVAGCGDSAAKLAEDIKNIDAIFDSYLNERKTTANEYIKLIRSDKDGNELRTLITPILTKLPPMSDKCLEKMKSIKVSEQLKPYYDQTLKSIDARKNYDDLMVEIVNNEDIYFGRIKEQATAYKNKQKELNKEILKTSFDRKLLKGQLLKEPPFLRVTTEDGEIYGRYVSNVGVAVTSVETKNEIGKGAYLSPTQAMGKFVIVGLVVKNEQKDAITVDSNSFELKDAKGNIFSHSSEGMTALMMAENNNKGFLTKLNPTMHLQFKVVFDIPKEMNPADFTLIAQGGFSGGKLELPVKVTRTGY